MTKSCSLCYRCEHRAAFLETGARPRYECGDIENAYMSCYMFKPVKPIIVEGNKGDGRPLNVGLLSCRYHAVGIADCELQFAKCKGDGVIYWKINADNCGKPEKK